MVVRWHGAPARNRHAWISPARLGLKREPEVADLAPMQRWDVIVHREDHVMRVVSEQPARDVRKPRLVVNHTRIIHARALDMQRNVSRDIEFSQRPAAALLGFMAEASVWMAEMTSEPSSGRRQRLSARRCPGGRTPLRAQASPPPRGRAWPLGACWGWLGPMRTNQARQPVRPQQWRRRLSLSRAVGVGAGPTSGALVSTGRSSVLKTLRQSTARENQRGRGSTYLKTRLEAL